MARVTLRTGDDLTVGGTTDVFGTSGAQSLTILDNSIITILGGFSNGGDTIRLSGKASDFVVSIESSQITFYSQVDGTTLILPAIQNGASMTFVFDGGDSRTLSRTGNTISIDGEPLTATPTALEDGPGVYEVTSTGEVIEGGLIQFTVTRTDSSKAETLNVTSLGDTNGGSIAAATPGADYTIAGTQLTWAAGDTSPKTFTISAPLDGDTEGLEGIVVRVLNENGEVVATTDAVIVDATPEGQTFQLTPGLDTVGTGVPTDLTGSGGNKGTGGNDTIVAVTGEVSLLNPNLGVTGTLTPFDNINGGAGDDTLLVLDNGNPFTSQPNFTGVTVDNVESLDYRAPTRGFLGGAFNVNTAGFDGLENATFFINAGTGAGTQTITLDDETTSTAANGITQTDVNTSAIVTQIGNAALVINGGGDSLVVQAALGDVTVGGTTASNSYDTVAIAGGNDITVNDRNVQELASVVLSGFADDATLTGTAITGVSVSGLADGSFYRDVTLTDAAAVAVTLSNIDVGDLDVTLQGIGVLTVNGDGSVDGLDDITAGNNVTVNSTSGTLVFDDIAAGGSNRTVNLNATGGNIDLDDLTAGDVIAVNITGTGSVDLDVVTQSADATGTVITSTNSGGVTIDSALASNTRFAGADSSGNDTVAFNGTDRSNSFGGGNDVVTFNADAFVNLANNGDTGSFDGGAGDDLFRMESNNANTFSATAKAVSNFETLELLAQTVAKHDTINLANLGFNATTGSDVISNVGDGSVAEVTTVSFGDGPTSSSVTGAGDKIVFSGRLDSVTDIEFADNTSATDIATAVRTQILADLPGVFSIVQNGSTLTLTDLDSGEITDLTGSISFVDGTSVGTPSLEQGTPIVTLTQGVTPVTAVAEQQTLSLTDVTLLQGETLTFSWDPDGAGGISARTFSYTNNTGANLTQNGGALADAIVAAANSNTQGGLDFDQLWTATRVGNDVVFTATGALEVISFFPLNIQAVPADGDRALITVTGFNSNDQAVIEETRMGVTGVTGVREVQTFVLDGVATGEDTLTFDGVTINFVDGSTPAQLAAQFNTQYTASGLTKTWEVISVVGSAVTVRSVDPGNRPLLTSNDFVFGDITNAGTPSIDVDVTTQGTDDSVTLNNFISGSTLTLNAALGTHTVNMADTSTNVLNLVLAAVGDHGVVTANEAETVTINTAGTTAAEDRLNLLDTDLTTLVISGANGLDLDTNSIIVSSVDASGLGGFFEWEAGANTKNIIVKTGSGGSLVDFSEMLIQSGNTVTNVEGNQTAPVLFIGGSGDDTVITGGGGTSRGTITTGAGNDTVFVGIVDGGLDNWSITDFDEKTGVDDLEFDVLDFAIAPIFDEEVQVLEPNATFQDYLDQAARGSIAGTIRYFYWQGDTYVVQDNGAGEDFQDGTDTVIRLEGEVELVAENFV